MTAKKKVVKKAPEESIFGYVIMHDEELINDGRYYGGLGEAEMEAEDYARDEELNNEEEIVIYKLVKVEKGNIEYERKVNWY